MAYREFSLDPLHPALRSAILSRRNILRALFALHAVLVLGGCASLPDVGPFVEATSQYRSAVVASGSAVDAELRAIDASDAASKFAEQWAVRVKATDALLGYSRSLASVVASGQQGAQAARNVADAVTGLATAVEAALPPAATVGTVTDSAAFVYGQIAAVRASQALGEALRNATPAVDQIATIMAKDLDGAQKIFDAANTQAKTGLVMQYNTETAYLKGLLDERQATYRKAPPQSAKDEERLLQIDRLVEATRAWRDPKEARERGLVARRKAGDQLFNAARSSLAAWSLAHRDLAYGVESGRKVDVTALVASIEEMRELIKRIQAL
jgi:hypothetical protein